jgi:purine-binding chemotaxis protein CheW
MTRLTTDPTSNERSLCIFERAGRTLGLPVWAVREVLGGETVSPVPCAPPELAGAINVRGEPLALVQIDDWIGARFRPRLTAEQILVFECDELQAGLIVDRVHDIRQCERRLAELPVLHGWPGPLAPREWTRGGVTVAILDPHQLVDALVRSTTAALRLASGGAGAEARPGEGVRVAAEKSR